MDTPIFFEQYAGLLNRFLYSLVESEVFFNTFKIRHEIFGTTATGFRAVFYFSVSLHIYKPQSMETKLLINYRFHHSSLSASGDNIEYKFQQLAQNCSDML